MGMERRNTRRVVPELAGNEYRPARVVGQSRRQQMKVGVHTTAYGDFKRARQGEDVQSPAVTKEPNMKPEEVLPDDVNDTVRDGVSIRKGSVGAFLSNARVLRDAAKPPDEREAARADL